LFEWTPNNILDTTYNKLMKKLLNQVTKKFLLNEAFNIDAQASVQALSDIVSSIRVTNKRDTNRLKLAKEHIRGIKRQMKSLNEKIDSLEQELNLLKEEK
jgi:DNA-binding FrmR family transcriptional regulator